MPQTGKRNPKDPYDARNPGVAPYKGSSDSELEAEERERRGIDPDVAAAVARGRRQPRVPPSMETPPDYGGPGMPREPGMMEPWEKPVTSSHANGLVNHLEAVVRSEIPEDDPRYAAISQARDATASAAKLTEPKWRQHMKKRKAH